MRIDFKQIEIHNFMSFEDEVFDFSSLRGMILVQGVNNDFPGQKNGSGKTSLMASLLYALFGQLQTKIKNENVISRFAEKKEMRLVLWFDVDSKHYKISRSITKKASSLELFKISDSLEEDITKSSIAETQKFLEDEILHCDISIFLRTILLTADQAYNFYLLKKADKKDFVEKLFDISLFEEIWKLVHRDLLDLDKELLSKQSYILGLGKNLDDFKTRVNSFSESHAKKLEDLRNAVEESSKKLDSIKSIQVKSDENSVKKLELAMSKLEEQRRKTWDESSSLADKISRCDLGIHKLEATRASNEKTVSKHAEVMSKLCNDCKKTFSSYYSLDKCIKEINDAKEKLAKLEAAKKDLITKRSIVLEDQRKTDSRIEVAREKLSSINSKAFEMRAKLARAEAEHANLVDDLEKAKTETNPWNSLLLECQQKIDEETAILDEKTKKHKQLELAESIVSQETLRKFVIKDLVVLLNNKIKTYLMELGAKFYVVFDEDMDYEFVTPSGTCEWANFSAGEKMKTMVATSFAFRDFMSARNGLNANVLVLDEYFDSAIDAMTVESVLAILSKWCNELNQSIYVISHRKEVSPDTFDHMLLVEKTLGVSHVKVDSL